MIPKFRLKDNVYYEGRGTGGISIYGTIEEILYERHIYGVKLITGGFVWALEEQIRLAGV